MDQILIYTKNNEKRTQIAELCSMMELSLYIITPQELGCPVALLGEKKKKQLKSSVQVPALYYQPDLILFNGLSDEALDNFLAFYRLKGIEPTALKAVVTPVNYSWPVFELTKELQKEAKELG